MTVQDLYVWRDFFYGFVPALPFWIALLTPVLVVAARQEVRLYRLAQILHYSKAFPRTVAASAPLVGAKADGTASELGRNPSYEFVRLKYVYDLPPAIVDSDDAMRILRVARKRTLRRSDWMLLVSAIGYVIVCYAGFSVLLTVSGLSKPADTPAHASMLSAFLRSILIVGGVDAGKVSSAEATMTIMGLAFLGAYLGSIRQFVRSLMVFDLSPATFLRQTVEIVSSMAIVTVLYRAFPDPLGLPKQLLGSISELSSDASSLPSGTSASWMWIALAVTFGLTQESSLRFLLTRFSQYMPWLKRDNDSYMPVTESIPLEVLDGISFPIRYRLQECGIEEVQNLATYNPIMLHIESPYGIYQTIDWVGQAQLCTVVGLDRFLLLKQINIRTILDLERAALSINTSPQLSRILAAALFSKSKAQSSFGKLSELKIPKAGQDGGGTEEMSVESFLSWVHGLVDPGEAPRVNTQAAAAGPVGVGPAVVENVPAGPGAAGGAQRDFAPKQHTTTVFMRHFIRLIVDDLHVHRLRRIWCDINTNLGDISSKLPDDESSGQAPGLACDQVACPRRKQPDQDPALAI